MKNEELRVKNGNGQDYYKIVKNPAFAVGLRPVFILNSSFLIVFLSSCFLFGSSSIVTSRTGLSTASVSGTSKPPDYFPLAVGNEWQFHVKNKEKSGQVLTWRTLWHAGDKWKLKYDIQTEGALPQQGMMAIAKSKSSIVFHMDCEEMKVLVLPPHVGSSWHVNQSEISPEYSATIVRVTDVTVPAGTFRSCVEVNIVLFKNESLTMKYFFARDVGPVKVVSLGGVTELVKATIGDRNYPSLGGSHAAEYFPLRKGNRWEYTLPGGGPFYSLTVTEAGENGAFVLVKEGATEKRKEFKLRRTADYIFMSGSAGTFPVIKLPPKPGMKWKFSPGSDKVGPEGEGRVVSVEEVKVPAGTFNNCVHTALTTNSPGLGLEYWFARGIGPVKMREVTAGKKTPHAVLSCYRVLLEQPAGGEDLPDVKYEKLATAFFKKDFRKFREGLSSARKKELPLAKLQKSCALEKCFATAAGILLGRLVSTIVRGRTAELTIEVAGERRVEKISMVLENNRWRIDSFKLLELFK